MRSEDVIEVPTRFAPLRVDVMLVMVFQRRIVSGLTAGAVKG